MILTANLEQNAVTLYYVDPDVKGAVDFYVNGNKMWMIEFCCDIYKLGEHIQRFTAGRYTHIPKKDWIVVQFDVFNQKDHGLLFSENDTFDLLNLPQQFQIHHNVIHVLYNDELSCISIFKIVTIGGQWYCKRVGFQNVSFQ